MIADDTTPDTEHTISATKWLLALDTVTGWNVITTHGRLVADRLHWRTAQRMAETHNRLRGHIDSTPDPNNPQKDHP